jgi:hypothetical protein
MSVEGSRTRVKFERRLSRETFPASFTAKRLLSGVASNVLDETERPPRLEGAELAEVDSHASLRQTSTPNVASRTPQRHRLNTRAFGVVQLFENCDNFFVRIFSWILTTGEARTHDEGSHKGISRYCKSIQL